MEKILLAILILSLVPLMACSESAPAAQSTWMSQVTAMWEASPTWNSYGPRITALEARPQSQASTFDSSNLNNKDSDLQSQINQLKSDLSALKSDQSWITSGTHTTPAGTTAGEYGELVDTNGDLELWLEKVGGDADNELLTTSKDYNSRSNFDFVVVNKDTSSSHSFKITLTFMPQVSVTTGTCAATADNGLTFTSSTRAADSEDDLRFTSNERRVAKSDNESFRVIVNVAQGATAAMVDWDISYDVLDKN